MIKNLNFYGKSRAVSSGRISLASRKKSQDILLRCSLHVGVIKHQISLLPFWKKPTHTRKTTFVEIAAESSQFWRRQEPKITLPKGTITGFYRGRDPKETPPTLQQHLNRSKCLKVARNGIFNTPEHMLETRLPWRLEVWLLTQVTKSIPSSIGIMQSGCINGSRWILPRHIAYLWRSFLLFSETFHLPSWTISSGSNRRTHWH